MKLTRRNFLGGVSALSLAPLLPAIAAPVPKAVWSPMVITPEYFGAVADGVTDSSFLGNTYVSCYVRAVAGQALSEPWMPAPSPTPWQRGDIVWNTQDNSGTLGWMCTEAGEA